MLSLVSYQSEAGTQILGSTSTKSKNEFYINNHYDFIDDGDKLTFTEFNFNRPYRSNILSLGFGRRVAFDQRGVLGFNLFYDKGVNKNKPDRFSLGTEWMNERNYLNLNAYLKNDRGMNKAGDYQFNNAFDVNYFYYIKNTRLIIGATYLHSTKNSDFFYNGRNADKDLGKLKLEYVITPAITLGYNYKTSLNNLDRNDNQFYIKFDFVFDKPLAEQLSFDINRADYESYLRNRKVERNFALNAYVKPVVRQPLASTQTNETNAPVTSQSTGSITSTPPTTNSNSAISSTNTSSSNVSTNPTNTTSSSGSTNSSGTTDTSGSSSSNSSSSTGPDETFDSVAEDPPNGNSSLN